jgi:hypothetical protein
MLPASFPTRAANYVAGEMGLMFFLLRMTFWLGLVLILLPSGASERAAPANQVNASEAISAASATVGDLRQFCTRQPDACIVGSHVATQLGYKAQAGAKMLYDFLTEALAHKEPSKDSTGSVSAMRPSAQNASQNTLTPADLAPAWRGPADHKTTKHTV